MIHKCRRFKVWYVVPTSCGESKETVYGEDFIEEEGVFITTALTGAILVYNTARGETILENACSQMEAVMSEDVRLGTLTLLETRQREGEDAALQPLG